MSENFVLEINEEKSSLGKIEIAPEVMEVIAGIATTEVDGVAGMRGNFAAGVVEILGRKNHGKGVKVIDVNNDKIKIDIYVKVKYGFSLPSVAEQIQNNVRQAIHTMTGVSVEEVNVHIEGIQFEQAKAVVE
ncbi:MAG: hypothetical protein K0S34_990 [Bacillales bacterium]|nr:hypothetical protein [Bacillales bacterium]